MRPKKPHLVTNQHIMFIMDDPSAHDDDDLQDNDLELEDTEVDEDDETPADTDGESDEPKDNAADVKAKQKKAWLENIKSGKKTLNDMPESLGWLKKEIESELKPASKNTDDIDSKVQKALKAEREKEDFGSLVDSLSEMDLDTETDAALKEEYESLISEGVSQYKALHIACKVVGIKDLETKTKERRRTGMTLPPFGTRKRETVSKDKMTELEKKFSGGLPGGFKA